MNIVFFGSSEFALPSLNALVERGFNIPLVITQPDKPKGRGLYLKTTVVKALAEKFNLKIYQPENVNTDEAISLFKSLNPDLFIVIAYGQILNQSILDIPKTLSMNIHSSLLPKYRGAAPINWAIIKGEETTGVTAIKMSAEMDAGPIILQEGTAINELDTAADLEEKLALMGAKLVLESIELIENNNYKLISQDENNASFAPKLTKQSGLIDWKKPAGEIYNLIRGCLDWPGAFTYYQGKLLKIYKARACLSAVVSNTVVCGQILEAAKDKIVAAAGKDSLIIEELQIEGKRKMLTREFLAGHKIHTGEIFGDKKQLPGG
ncbi:MAG: methionyl-tRNA formyltransferase [Candidatus Omnitrophota bacterium]